MKFPVVSYRKSNVRIFLLLYSLLGSYPFKLMPIFKYTGYKEDGSEIQGTIEADSQRDAALKVKTTGIYPKDIAKAVFSKRQIFSVQHVSRDLPAVTRSLSTLIASGVAVTEAVRAVSSEQKGYWRDILTDIKERLLSGASLARAMQTYPSIFPEFYVSMVSAGENSGRLPDVLLKLSDFMESQETIKNKVRTSLVYPVFMLFVSAFILFFLFAFVVPKITKIFEETSATLPLITVALIWISSMFNKLWWLAALLMIAALIFYRDFKESKKEAIDALLLKMPFGVLQSLYLSRVALTMSFLLSGGISILQAMQLGAKAAGNSALENKVMAARTLVSQGAKLSDSLEGLPPTFLQLISTGEQSGQLSEVLNRAAISYEAEFDRKLQRLVGLLEPSLILFMGIVVGFIVIAILLPIFELNQLVK
ncbi:MAG: type II secretion system F family protein [Nitrospirae bacterium]|nr:type II secretion system F family protein [Nitrospirota bacterium]